MKTQAEILNDYAAAQFKMEDISNADYCWRKQLGNGFSVVLAAEDGGNPREGSDLVMYLLHDDGRVETTLMQQTCAFDNLEDILSRFIATRGFVTA